MMDWGVFALSGTGASGVAGLVTTGDGVYKMARTLSPQSPNQVSAPGRKIITAWIDGGNGATATAQALPRDLTLDGDTGELLQQLSPELQALRTGSGDPVGVRSLQVEVVATFYLAADADPDAVFGVNVLMSEDGTDMQVRVSNVKSSVHKHRCHRVLVLVIDRATAELC